MEITFVNPGAEEMLRNIMGFQTEEESVFWSEPLFYFYPQLDKARAAALPFSERKAYIERVLLSVYEQEEKVIDEKVLIYSRQWEGCKEQITAALSEAFEVDCNGLFNDLRGNVTLNPVMPRFLREHCCDLFYLSSGRGAIGLAIHELVHFVWFYVWNQLFGDSYDEYERPSLKWILSEMVVESVMKDPRLSSINPYFPREDGGCIYPYFFDMKADGVSILDTLDKMYQSQSISAFMKNSYAYCQAHETEIREHIRRAENRPDPLGKE